MRGEVGKALVAVVVGGQDADEEGEVERREERKPKSAMKWTGRDMKMDMTMDMTCIARGWAVRAKKV